MSTIESRVREIACEVGLDPDDAMRMDFVEFARTVSIRRALRDSQRIALSTMARRRSTPARAL